MYTLIAVVAYTLSQANPRSETAIINRMRSEMHSPLTYISRIQAELQPTERYEEIKRSLEIELKLINN